MRASFCLIIILVAGIAAGCADHTPQSIKDLQACRRSADMSMGPDAAIAPEDEHTMQPMVLARREKLRDEYNTLVDQCMATPKE
jgi:hypothetical protein